MTSDGVIITVEIVVKPDMAEQVCAGLPAMFNDTAAFEGFRSIRVVRHKNEPNRLLIVEHWDTEDHYKAYQAWRDGRGDTAAAQSALLSYRYDAWPVLIGAASA